MRLSSREQEVLHLIAYENNTLEIAKKLFLSPHTVITYRRKLLNKLNARNTVGLVRRAFEKGFFLAQ